MEKNSYLKIRDMLRDMTATLQANEIARACDDPCAMTDAEIDELRDEVAYLTIRIGGDVN